jgi:hypothetical protein
MPKFTIHALERIIIQTIYRDVEADSADAAIDKARAGSVAYVQPCLAGAREEYLRTLTVQPQPTEEEVQAAQDVQSAALDKIDARVTEACRAAGHRECHVSYAAYPEGDGDEPVDNLDEVAIQGKCRLLAAAATTDVPYKSDVLENPTWLQLCVCANMMIATTGCSDHCFLEDIYYWKKTDGDNIPLYRFSMGS